MLTIIKTSVQHSATKNKSKNNKGFFKASIKLYLCCLLIFGLDTSSAAAQEETSNKKPNIIFIMADDLGYGDISALNSESKIRTPVLDRLISEGRNFTEAHTSTSLCSPTRYALLTGRYSFRTGKRGVASGYSEPWIEYERETLASLLKKAGYTTAIIGKWHLGLEWQPKNPSRPVYTKDAFIPDNLNVDYSKPVKGVNEIGFDYSFISPAGNNLAPFTFVKNGDVIEQPTKYISPQKGKGITLKTRRNGGDIAPEFEFDQTLNFLTKKQSPTFNIGNQIMKNPSFSIYLLLLHIFPGYPVITSKVHQMLVYMEIMFKKSITE